jgi:hypothetical protein
MASNTPWPAERTERLRALRAAQANYRAISAELGLSQGAVAGKLFRLGLTRKRERKPSALELRLNWPQVSATGCRWVEGDPRGVWHWCNAPREGRTSWCRKHLAQAYGATKPPPAFREEADADSAPDNRGDE